MRARMRPFFVGVRRRLRTLVALAMAMTIEHSLLADSSEGVENEGHAEFPNATSY